jgi:hypothetical protein
MAFILYVCFAGTLSSASNMITFTFLIAFPFVARAAISPIFGKSHVAAHQLRSLKAASDRNALQRRADDWELSHHTGLIYSDGMLPPVSQDCG